MCAGSVTHAKAEEARSKLLLGPLPHGVSAADEVAARLCLWEAGSFEALLQRSEQQLIVAGRRRTRGRASRRMTLTDPAEKSSTALIAKLPAV